MAMREKTPISAVMKLIHDYGYNATQLERYGLIRARSTIYGAEKKDVNNMRGRTFIEIANALGLTPGEVLNKLLALQKQYPPLKKYKPLPKDPQKLAELRSQQQKNGKKRRLQEAYKQKLEEKNKKG